MTKITIFKKNGKIYEYQVKGHSGYAPEGADIVCSAISVASQMALVGLSEVLHLPVQADIQEGYLHVKLLQESESAQPILQAMELTMRDVQKTYAKYVKMEVREDVY